VFFVEKIVIIASCRAYRVGCHYVFPVCAHFYAENEYFYRQMKLHISIFRNLISVLSGRFAHRGAWPVWGSAIQRQVGIG